MTGSAYLGPLSLSAAFVLAILAVVTGLVVTP